MKYIKTILLLAVAAWSSSCDDYLDINDDPNRVTDVTLEALLGPTIESTARNYYNVAFVTSQVSQQTGSVFGGGADAHEEFRLETSWTGIFLTALTNLNIIIEKAEVEESPHYAGVAKILQAVNLGLATDQWGDIPLTEAFKGDEQLTPKFDSQESVYNRIQTLLDEAITDLSSQNSLFSPSNDDLMYGGRLEQWIKAAYTLKARYYLHLTKRDGATAANSALDALANGFTSNDDDLQLVYNSIIRNPWHLTPALANNTGNASISMGEQLINAMNGTSYPTFDPRLPIIADNGDATVYEGIENGSGNGGNSDFSESTWYSTETAPLLIITYAEMKLIEAEARLIINPGTNEGYEAYLAGIIAHMNKLGVDPGDRNDYISDPSVSVGSDNLAIEEIMKEKYIALFINPEAWTDLRRYDYDPNIFRNFDLPAEHNPQLAGEFIRRVLYPNDEINRNFDEVSKVIQGLEVPIWWDEN
ncbi:MAG: SusD/RagB family nutrient-binding outer membrane lipoprotein [Cytophagales bacterium]|nr:SusD/RagB family nutrient-binding outer membrane lipoprotein [Cytophagales bacterium]